MRNKAIVIFAMVFMSFSLLIFPTYVRCQSEQTERDRNYYKEEGLKHYKEGLNRLTPKGKTEEALKEYLLAIKAFREALKISEDEETRLNLAKVYYIQKNYAMAAVEYKRASELAPYNIDTYVDLALAYMYLKRYDRAIETLERAQTRTSDDVIIEKLDSYITTVEKVRDRKEGAIDD